MKRERETETRDERKDDFVEKCLKPEKPPDELAQNVAKKIPFGRIIPHFSSNVQNLTVFSIVYMIRIRFFGPRELIKRFFSPGQ